MPDEFRTEFTGERVIPGRVEDNLFNEHLARYRFTARLWNGAGRLLDAGCGAGYGAAELAKSGAEVLGIDISEEAIAHARANYATASNLRFEQASCMAIPAGTQAFRLIAAFEVIEHLEDWRAFLREASRVLDNAGLFLVSTPNRLYYAESRQKAGPNPFHVHEFTEEEFRSELGQVFPQVKILLQNHVEGIAFSGAETEGDAIEISERKSDPDRAHFFLAVCGKQPLPPIAGFVFIPESGNVLQTRERHIALLDGEIVKKNQWIEREQVERQKMLDKVREMETELEEHNQWAQRANLEAEHRAQLVAALQEELQKSNEWAQNRDAEAVKQVAQAVAWAKDRDAEAEERGNRVVELQTELAEATAWATSLDVEAGERGARIVQLQEEMAATISGYEGAIEQWRQDKAAADRWALGLEEQLQRLTGIEAEAEQLRAQLADANRRMDMIAQSRWVRLGRVVKVGPEIHRN